MVNKFYGEGRGKERKRQFFFQSRDMLKKETTKLNPGNEPSSAAEIDQYTSQIIYNLKEMQMRLSNSKTTTSR